MQGRIIFVIDFGSSRYPIFVISLIRISAEFPAYTGHSMRSASCASAQCKGFPWTQGVSRGGRIPHECGGGQRTFTPLHWCWTVGRCLGRVAVTCVSTTLGPWGLLATWPGVVLAPSSAVGVATCHRGDSAVVVCAGCEICVTRLCMTLGMRLCRQDDSGGGGMCATSVLAGGGGGACCLALVVVGGMCPVTRGGMLPQC